MKPSSTPSLTHKELCELALVWLKRPHSRKGPGCQVAFSEGRNGFKDGEIPDALGFRSGVHDETTVLVEVKASRSDFLADKAKPYRLDPSKGMGLHRYYLAPQGLIKPEELPASWGLVEVSPKRAITAVRGHVLLGYAATLEERKAWEFPERNFQREISILARLLYRFGDVQELNRSYKDLRASNSQLRTEVNQLSTQLRQKNGDLNRLQWQLKKLEPASSVLPAPSIEELLPDA